MKSALILTLAAAAVVAACSSDDDDRGTGVKRGKGGLGDPNATAQNGNTANAKNAAALAPVPEQTRVMATTTITSPRQVSGAGPFTGKEPTVRANDRHGGTVVTGKDCMTCHGTGGTAPHFSYGGTIALGQKWVWAAPGAANQANGPGTPSPNGLAPSPNAYDDYNDGSYDDGSYGGGTCANYGGGYNDDGYGDGSYGAGGGGGGNYGSYDDGSYDDGSYSDDTGYGSCGRKGYPGNRDYPSQQTEVRIVGADGYVYDTMTDTDGNFWFKNSADVAVPAYTGLHYGDFVMTGDTNGVACASCHESGKPDSPGRLWTWTGKTPKWGQTGAVN